MWKRRIAEVVQTALTKTLVEADVENAESITAKIEYAAREEFGDYACTNAMELARTLRKAPVQIAEDIAKNIASPYFEKVAVAPPGFINITLSTEALNEGVREVLTSNAYGKNVVDEPKRLLVEYVSANPTGPLHIGHGRWAAIGDTLTRVLAYAGHEVSREFYINDAGVQIEKLRESVDAAKKGEPIPEDGYHGAYIKDLANEEDAPEAVMLRNQQELLARFRVTFDTWFSERSIRDAGKVEAAIELLREEGYLFEKEGALWFKSTAFGDDKDRVLRKSDGNYTYFAVDIAYHADKVLRGYDALVNVFGADHHGYVPRLSAAVEVLSKGKTKLIAIIGQLVRLFRGKEPVRMSKRTGDMISLEDVIDEIGIDSTRYFLVMRAATTALDFDLELAKKQDNDNPVYYVQYAYARICNIFLQLEEKGLSYDPNATFTITLPASGCDAHTAKVAKMLMRFPDEVREVTNTYEVHRLVAYAYDLAGAFHRFYYENIVLSDDEDERTTRLALARATRNVLGLLFDLIGITRVERM